MGLEGRVALITGAAGGIGAATARRFVAEGAAVALTDVEVEGVRELAADLRAAGGRVFFVEHDVADEDAWRRTVARTIAELGGLDVLVNNAGIGDGSILEEVSLEDYECVIAVTQTGVFLGMKHAAAPLKASGRGAVVNVSSTFGVVGGFGNAPAYAAAKAGVRNLTKNVALHWAREGVRVNSVHPGFTLTPTLRRPDLLPLHEQMIQETPMGRLGRPEEIAAAIVFLASDDASFVTGAELHVDGGFLAR